MSRLSVLDSDLLFAHQYIDCMNISVSDLEATVEKVQGALVLLFRVASKASDEKVLDAVQLMYMYSMDIVSELEEVKKHLSFLSSVYTR
ncbi:hypothetical protein XFHB_05965 [Xylella fastidiosa]|uniref:Uncharacterized protein n=1 Tax=Xylella fastidiosa TaxID=2371 RepID=A0ABC8ADU4_XYLFS|nr:hypothetical protein [Xylella fastidiosa]ALR06445.1 hypothetical protein XFHB_05905 [Xylella fastidiosa]ALR06455.1 hypothetical protein XFHB_05965 [Xylella fastidiosa]